MQPSHPRDRRPAVAALGLLALAVLAPIVSTPSVAAQPVPDEARVDRIFQEWDREGSPGCAVGVYHRGELVLARGYGEANLDWGIPITPSTVFYSGSVSKQFAAATAALLHLDGTLDLDEEVRAYIPELPAYDPPVTLRHLAHHVSGVRDIYGLISLSGGRTADAWTDEEYLALIAAQRELNFPAGSRHLYSNGGYFLLTTVLERVSGMSLDELARERIFEPLGMDDTHFHQDRTRLVPRRAMSYGGTGESGFSQTYLGNFDKAGAGGLYTTIQDLAAWDRNFETGEVGGPEFLDLIQRRGVLTDGDTLSYAFGLTHGELGELPTVGHSGSFMGFRADFVRLPTEGISAAALCNLGGINPSGLTRQLLRETLGLEEAESEAAEDAADDEESRGTPPAEPPSAALRDYAGSYYSDEVGSTLRVRWDEGGLRALSAGSDSFREMEWEGGDRFRLGSWTLDFQVEGGEVTGVRLDAGRVRNLLFVRGTP